MKRKLLMFVLLGFVCVGVFNNINKITASEDKIEIDAQLYNLTNPGMVATENDELQVVVKFTPKANVISTLNYSVNQVNYSIDENSVVFTGNMTNKGIDVDGTYRFALVNMVKGSEYTLTYNIQFTGAVADTPVSISPLNGSYNGKTSNPMSIFSGTTIDLNGSGIKVYGTPQKNIQKEVTNLTTTDGKNRVGDIVEYKIVVENTSVVASLWEQIQVSDYVPSHVKVDVSTIALDGVSLSNYTVDGSGAIMIPVNDLANGSVATITFKAEILETAYDKTIINTAKVDGLEASDSGVYIEKKDDIKKPDDEKPEVKDPDKEKPEIKDPNEESPKENDKPIQNESLTPEQGSASSNDTKTTTINPSVVSPLANGKGGVKTMDSTNVGMLSFALLASMGAIIVFIKRKSLY